MRLPYPTPTLLLLYPCMFGDQWNSFGKESFFDLGLRSCLVEGLLSFSLSPSLSLSLVAICVVGGGIARKRGKYEKS